MEFLFGLGVIALTVCVGCIVYKSLADDIKHAHRRLDDLRNRLDKEIEKLNAGKKA